MTTETTIATVLLTTMTYMSEMRIDAPKVDIANHEYKKTNFNLKSKSFPKKATAG